MMNTKQMLEEWESNPPKQTKQPDFNAFWEKTLKMTKENPLCPVREEMDSPMQRTKVYRISYHGFDQTPVQGILMIPESDAPVPCLIHYHGYTGSKGLPHEFAPWLMLGMAVLSIDAREQGGETGNEQRFDGPRAMGVASLGIQSPETYYFRAVYMDALKAVDFAAEQPEIDASKLILEGASQGGGLTLAVAAFDTRPIAVLCDVPSNCNIPKRIWNEEGCFSEIAVLLRSRPDLAETALRTVSYFDHINLAERITCPVFASVGMKDRVCPAEYFMGAYSYINSPKEVHAYPLNGHEGGHNVHMEKKLNYVYQMLKK